MTPATALPAQRLAPVRERDAWVRDAAAHAPVYAATALLLALAVAPLLAAAALDGRVVAGAASAAAWTKPLKFAVALALYAGTLALFMRYVPERVRDARWHRIFVGVVAACIAYEMIWIVGASAAGIPSHFNLASPLMATAYQLAGLGAVILTSASLVVGLAIAGNRATGLPPALKLSLVCGLVLTFAATVPVAAYLSSQAGPFVGGAGAAPAWTWPIVGWAGDRGDLRVPHFLATHAIHVIPLVGLAAVALRGRAGGRGLVILGTAAYAGLIAWAFIEARAGRPFPSLPIG
ncbi:hypothetical protein ACTZWW_17415 [Salinarimonas sp. NSM]|uniref:hypothetical protein n=1 Tax=Salinarimonas sp. NSM TaxID=3458003 RepID=UPI0040369D41